MYEEKGEERGDVLELFNYFIKQLIFIGGNHGNVIDLFKCFAIPLPFLYPLAYLIVLTTSPVVSHILFCFLYFWMTVLNLNTFILLNSQCPNLLQISENNRIIFVRFINSYFNLEIRFIIEGRYLKLNPLPRKRIIADPSVTIIILPGGRFINLDYCPIYITP